MNERLRVVLRQILGILGIFIFIAVIGVSVKSSGVEEIANNIWAERVAYYAFGVFALFGLSSKVLMLIDMGPNNFMYLTSFAALFLTFFFIYICNRFYPDAIVYRNLTSIELWIFAAFILGWPIIDTLDLLVAWWAKE